MKNKKSQIPDGVGLLISDVVGQLSRRGFSVTTQQVRQFEDRDKFFKSIRTPGNYREYTPVLVDTIEFILRLEICGFSKKRIKGFFDLRKRIEKHSAVETRQVLDAKVGQYGFVRRLRVDVEKGDADYLEIQMLINEHEIICREIKERLENVKQIMDIGIADIEARKRAVNGIIKK